MESRQLWEKIIVYRKREFPDLSLLVSLCLCVSGSNPSVERAFNILTTIMSDRRLSMSHKTMENRMLIAGNDRNWSEEEREQLIMRAVDLYMEKRRTVVDSNQGNTIVEDVSNQSSSIERLHKTFKHNDSDTDASSSDSETS